MSHFWTNITSIVFAFTGVFLMFIILLQRGRGGGLAGAFGGAGGQSAFGTKAGDVFTRITIVVAIVWVALAAVTGFAMQWERPHFESAAPEPTELATPAIPKEESLPKDAGKENAKTGTAEPSKSGSKSSLETKLPAPTDKGSPASKSKPDARGKTSSKQNAENPADAAGKTPPDSK